MQKFLFTYWYLIIAVFVNFSCAAEINNKNKYPKLLNPPCGMEKSCTSSDKLYAVGRNRIVYLWDWKNLDQKPKQYETSSSKTSWMANSKIIEALFVDDENSENPVIIKDLNGKEYNRWLLGKDWYCRYMRNTYNGKFVIIIVQEEIDVALDRNPGSLGIFRLGIIDLTSTSINWIAEFEKIGLGPSVHNIAVSENGKRVAVCGIKDGGWLLVADVKTKKVLHEIRPDWSVNFNDLCFSADGKTVYIGGNGGIYRFDIATGKLNRKCPVKSRIVGVAASPDGRLIAGGTAASGNVYIFEAQTLKLIRHIQTGQYTLYNLAFSPDSRYLATEGVKNTNIKIWKMPE